MPIIIKPAQISAEPDYKSACKHTVTLYNVYKSGTNTIYHKTLFRNSAFLENKRVYQESRTGITSSNSALLVIPYEADGNTYIAPEIFDTLEDKEGFYTLRKGDKAMRGVGADIVGQSEWAKFTPAINSSIVLINAVDVKFTLNGEIAHIESGG